MTRESRPRAATAADAGRNCPYCRFPLKPGAALAACAACDAAHHDDCWAENGGCAVVGCQNGPQAGPAAATEQVTAGGTTASWSPATAAAPSVIATSEAGAGPQPPRRGIGGLVAAAIVVLALVIAGSAAAFVLTRDDGGDRTAAEAITTVTETAATSSGDDQAESETEASGATGVDRGTTTEDGGGALPDVSETEMAEEIATVIGDYHRAIGNGDTDTAWDLLSARRHRLETSQVYRDGRFRDRESWESNELETGRKIDPGSPVVEILELDRRHGVATVDVRGMRAVGAAGRRCGGRWEGTTWAKYEDGRWTYEPGANTTPSRKQRYPNAGQRSDLLGNTCQ